MLGIKTNLGLSKKANRSINMFIKTKQKLAKVNERLQQLIEQSQEKAQEYTRMANEAKINMAKNEQVIKNIDKIINC